MNGPKAIEADSKEPGLEPVLSASGEPALEVGWTRESWQSHGLLIGFLICFSLAFFVLNHGLDCPNNDDWAYAWPVDNFLKTGKLLLPASSASCFAPVFIGIAATKLSGFSYNALHVVSWVYCLLGTASLYLALLELRMPRSIAACAATLFCFNPLVFNQCFAYMTDLPALAFTCLFLLFGLRTLNRLSLVDLGLSSLALFLALASRQSSIVFLLPLFLLGLAVLLNGPAADKQRGRSFAIFIGCLLACALLFVSYKGIETALLACQMFPAPASSYRDMLFAELAQVLQNPLSMLPAYLSGAAKIGSYLGLFLSPLLVGLATAAAIKWRSSWRFLALALPPTLVLAVVPGAYNIAVDHSLMPYGMNLFRPPAVGTYCLIAGGMPLWSTANLLNLSLVAALMWGLFSIFVFAGLCAKQDRKDAFVGSRLFLISAFLTPLLLLLLQSKVHNLDRYYLMVLPPAILLLAVFYSSLSKWAKQLNDRLLSTFPTIVSAIFCLMLFAFSCATALDYNNFLRAREHAVKALLNSGVSLKQIDAGPEYNYIANFSLISSYEKSKKFDGYKDESRGAYPMNQYRWWPVSAEDYIVSGMPFAGYNIKTKIEYFSPLKFRKMTLLVLEKGQSG